jgi:hypothetical protein
MSDTAFYAPRKQFRRALGWDLHFHSIDLFLTPVLYPLAGFYIFRRPGMSQVYDVTWPFLLAAVAMSVQTIRVCWHEVKGATVPFYGNLPGEWRRAFDARLGVLFASALWLEAVVFAGAAFKLGGAGITPHYRFEPEYIVLPFYAVAVSCWYMHSTEQREYAGALLFCAIALPLVWLGTKAAIAPDPTEANNYFPSREMPLLAQGLTALAMAGAGAWFVAMVRARHRPVGDVQ